MIEILNRELAREFLLQEGIEISDDAFEKLWVMCKGNPWDAPVLYRIMVASQDKP